MNCSRIRNAGSLVIMVFRGVPAIANEVIEVSVATVYAPVGAWHGSAWKAAVIECRLYVGFWGVKQTRYAQAEVFRV